MLSEVFYSLVVTSGIAFVLAIAKLISRSRCDEISCFGCCRIHRNVELENLEIRNETKEEKDNN